MTNWVFDKFGTYKPMFVICAAVMTVVTIVFQFVISASHKDRQRGTDS